MKPNVVCLVCVLAALPVSAAETPGRLEGNGLRVEAKPTAERFAADAPITVAVTFKNTSGAAFRLFDANFWVYGVNGGGSWHCILKNAATGRAYRPTVVIRPMIARIPQVVTLPAGGVHKTTVQLTRALDYRPVGERVKKPGVGPPPARLGPARRPMFRRCALPPGRYRLFLTITLKRAPGPLRRPRRPAVPFWVGTVRLATAPFEFGDVAGIVPGRWIPLFADKPWYKRCAGKEREFTGVLKVKPKGPPVLTTLMRTCYYHLGGRRVYTGGRRVAVLEKLGGKTVTFRGKAVEMNLEGRHLKEIWPAAVVLVKKATTPPR